MHGVVMVWFFLIPSIPTTLGNFLVPLMIGARDLAFPRLNLASWYLFMLGGCVHALRAVRRRRRHRLDLLHAVLDHVLQQPRGRWRSLGVFIAGFSSILTGLNFIVTIHMLRAPGLTWFRLPLFIWSLYATAVILVLATPVLAMTLLLHRARALAAASASSIRALGGDPLLFQHLFWFYSPPGRLHHDPAGHGRGQRDRSPASRASRIFGYKFIAWCQHRHRGDRLLRLGPPHVRERAVAVTPAWCSRS